MDYPKITVITPSFNQGRFLEETINSVLSQNYPNLEYFIIDGDSSDNSVDIIRKYEKALSYWVSEKDNGQTDAINKGFRRSSGDLLVWLNSDDFYYPNALVTAAEAYLAYPEAGLYTGNGFLVDEQGRNPKPYALSSGFDYEALLKGSCYMLQPATFINRKAFEKLGFLDEMLRYGMDLEYWLRVGKEFQVIAIDAYLAAYRWYDAVKTNEGFSRWTELLNIYRRYTAQEMTPGLLVEFFSILKKDFILKDLPPEVKELADRSFGSAYSLMQKDLGLKDCIPQGRGIIFTPSHSESITEKTQAPAFIRSPGSKARIDILLQATGTHAWGVGEGWANAAKEAGILNRIFRPRADWGAAKVSHDDGLWSYLKDPDADILLLLGFDWHSQMLHSSTEWRARLNDAGILKVLYVQEAIQHNCHLFGNNLMREAALSAASCTDAIVYTDLSDGELFAQTGKPSLWQPFGVDETIFCSRKDFRQRNRRAFFRGKTTPFFTDKTYERRRALIQYLLANDAIDLLEYREKTVSPEEIADDFNAYQIAVNFPSVFSNHPTRVYEALACGSALVTNRTGVERVDALFNHGEHLLYFDGESELLEAIHTLSSDSEYAESLAKTGCEYTLENFSLTRHLSSILTWIENAKGAGKGTKAVNRSDTSLRPMAIPSSPKGKIVIDGVIFYLQQYGPGGITRVWRSLLMELSRSSLADKIVLLDREGRAPEIPGIRRRIIKAYDHKNFEDDSLYLEDICREEGASLLISTYHTFAENTHSVIMLHDMVPEIKGMDLSQPEWRAKAKAIEKAMAYFCVSHSTLRDFRKLHPDLAKREIFLTPNACSTEFRRNTQKEIDIFKEKHRISKPYFLLVGHRMHYKNAILFFRAFSQLPSRTDYEIICTGGEKNLERLFLPYVKSVNCRVLSLSDEDLAVAYSGAIALVYPSQYEGFGLPVLEAMNCGCPVITCRNSSLSNVAGEAALYVDEIDVADMMNALLHVQEPDIREMHVSKGFENVKRFSWEKTGLALVEAIGRIMNSLQTVPLNATEPLNTFGRLKYEMEKREEWFDLSPAASTLEKMYGNLIPYDPLLLKQCEKVIAAMPKSIFDFINETLPGIDDVSGFFRYFHGLALEHRGLVEEAMNSYLEAALRDDQGRRLQWRPHLLAAEIVLRSGDTVRGKDMLADLLQRFPECTDARERLDALHSPPLKLRGGNGELCPISIDKTNRYISSANVQSLLPDEADGIRVTALVSTYNSARFMRGCLEDLVGQTLFEKGQLEIVVIDSGSEQDEKSIVDEFRRRYGNIFYERTARETIYAAWNRGISMARGRYLTNANADDRHREDSLEVMADLLDANPEIALVYGDQIITSTENQTFDLCDPVGFFKWPAYDRMQLLHCSCVGPQPMWRKDLHMEFGYFDESLSVAGDYEWWLRVSEKYPFEHIPELVGLYLRSAEGLEKTNPRLTLIETVRVRSIYGERAGISCDFTRYRTDFLSETYDADDTEGSALSSSVPEVSVIVPTFNRPEMLERALKSVLDQTFANIEIIVVNDGGEDVRHVVEKLRSEKIRYKKLYANRGPAAARNEGIRAARGRYVAYLDDDDVFYPHHIESIVKYLGESGLKVAYSNAARAFIENVPNRASQLSFPQAKRDGNPSHSPLEKGEKGGCSEGFRIPPERENDKMAAACGFTNDHLSNGGGYRILHRKEEKSPDFDADRMLVGNFIPLPCVMHEIVCLENTGFFDETLKTHEDWELWIRLSRVYRFGHIEDVTVEFADRMDKSGISAANRPDMLRTAELIHAMYPVRENPALVQARRQWLQTLRRAVFERDGASSVSIIIPVFNNLTLTRQCVDAIRGTTGNSPYEIIIVDNASSDGTRDYLAEEHASGRLVAILNEENLGFSKANNQGASVASGNYLVFLNNDTIPQPGWLEEMLRTAVEDGTIGAVGSRLLYPDGAIQHAGIAYYKNRRPYHIYKGCPASLPAANKPRFLQSVSGACMLIGKSLFLETGCFDERYVNGCEDLDLCMKVLQKGKKVFYNPASVLVHLESQSKGRQDMMDSNRKLFEQTWFDRIVPDDDSFLEEDGMERLFDNKGDFYFRQATLEEPENTAIIIVTYNSASTIRKCIESILLHTRRPFQITVVDNASADGTLSILKEYEDRITLLLNGDNKGFSYACNQGIRMTSGKYIVLLNPDTIVTPAWLSRLLAHFGPRVGAVGPLSNYTNGAQLSKFYIGDPQWEKIAIEERAERLYRRNRGIGKETKLLIGFCIALPRRVLDQVGLLDEDLFLGSEDLELSWRLRQRGLKLIIATDTFVYHKGQVSFKAAKTPPSTQESVDRLYAKLKSHYGPRRVPHPRELWNIDFFRPRDAEFIT